jgi:hypothetical protein
MESFVKDLDEKERSKFDGSEARVLILSTRVDLEADWNNQ